MILVYSTLICTYKCKQVNYIKSGSNNATGAITLGHKGKTSIFSEKGKTRMKNDEKDKKKMEKNRKNIQKLENFFIIFEKASIIHTTIPCMKCQKYVLHCVKCSRFFFLSFSLSFSFVNYFFGSFFVCKTLFSVKTI